MNLTSEQIETLSALCDGIIPPDERDAGAAAVHAAPRLGEKISAGMSTALYARGIQLADDLACSSYGRRVCKLTRVETDDLMARVRDALPGFFKQLRMDV